MTQVYPLQWPEHVKRTDTYRRTRAKFGKGSYRTGSDGATLYTGKQQLTVAEGIKRLFRELDRLGAGYIVVSSNVEIRQDGLPRSNQREPTDPGVAVYFQLKKKPYCLPCDRYDRVADNIAAIAGHVAATRTIERYGVGTVEQAFQGFAALPPKTDTRPWRVVMGLHREPKVTLDMVEERYRTLARERHPDTGGGHAMMAELNAARDAAKQELSTP